MARFWLNKKEALVQLKKKKKDYNDNQIKFLLINITIQNMNFHKTCDEGQEMVHK